MKCRENLFTLPGNFASTATLTWHCPWLHNELTHFPSSTMRCFMGTLCHRGVRCRTKHVTPLSNGPQGQVCFPAEQTSPPKRFQTRFLFVPCSLTFLCHLPNVFSLLLHSFVFPRYPITASLNTPACLRRISWITAIGPAILLSSSALTS